MKMTDIYLVTGGSGFIGSVLLRKLISNKENVHLILRKESNLWRISDLLDKVTIHYSDLSNVSDLQSIVEKINPTVIHHLATNGAYSSQNDANQIIQTNFLGTWNLLQACNKVNYKIFVNTGSSSEYGFKKYAMRETDILEPASYYAVTKGAQSLLCSHIAHQEGKPIVTIRPYSVYGPYEEPTRLIPTLMMSLLNHKQMNLVSSKVARDYIYVDDVVDAYLNIKQLQKNKGEIFNIGTGVQTDMVQLVNKTQKISGEKTELVWGGMKNRTWDTSTWVADISKARQLLNWQPKVDLEEGLTKTWKWLLVNNNLYQK